MSTRPLSAESLLAHESFVRAVVRGLVRDEAEVQDVLQETWLRGQAGVPEGGALRAWLARVARNLALDQRRAHARRVRRERPSARAEAVEAVDAAYARLSTQREVVDSVLALEEPYRGVVLLRYFEGLEPTAIAARLARSPGTVRSQLTRAHELLRGRLDRSCGRERWAVLAVPLARHALWSGARLGLVLACGVLGVLGFRLWTTEGRASAPRTKLASAEGAPPPQVSELEPAELPVSTSARAALPPDAAPVAEIPRAPLPVELAALPLDERLALAVQLMRSIEADLVRVDPALVARHAAFLASEGTGIARVLDGRKARLVLSQGGCAYFSFATGQHSYNSEPDISFHLHLLKGGFYGGQMALLFEAGPVPLASVPLRPEPIPGWVPEERSRDWELLWSELDASKWNEARSTALDDHVYPVTTGHTFLVRVRSTGEHDHLVAFNVLALDDDGCTILWRRLAVWPLAEPKRGDTSHAEEHRDVGAAPAWLDRLGLEERIRLLGELRAGARDALLEVPEASREKFAREIPNASFARLLPLHRWDPLLESTWESAYYSFENASNDYKTAILGLQDEFGSGFSGRDKGLFVDLGRLTDPQLHAVWSGRRPDGLSSLQRNSWDFLFEVQPERDAGARTVRLSEADAARAHELGLRDRAEVALGHVYLLRSALFERRDQLVCFRVLDRTHEGVSLAWRELARWPVEPR